MGLQNQRGMHSSLFFKGTHQCCHKVFYFENYSFDAMFVDFTQEDQAIPSPWGMPAFELVDIADPSDFIMDYVTFESVTTPDFTGARVQSYIALRDICVHLRFIDNAFPSSTEANDYFSQCPSEFNTALLESFRSRCKTSVGRQLFNAARSFQVDTMKHWNGEID